MRSLKPSIPELKTLKSKSEPRNEPVKAVTLNPCNLEALLEGQGDLVSRLIMLITRVTIWVIGVANLRTKPPCLPSNPFNLEAC